jgi:hypothetical protein
MGAVRWREGRNSGERKDLFGFYKIPQWNGDMPNKSLRLKQLRSRIEPLRA